jgi:hypothetical protein
MEENKAGGHQLAGVLEDGEGAQWHPTALTLAQQPADDQNYT